jgi:maltose-binding protein MalE
MRAFFVGLAVAVSVAGALVACSSSTDVTRSAKQTLDQNQALWEQRTFGSYGYDLLLQDQAFSADVHITVNGTTVVSVVDTAGVPVTDNYHYPSIDDLFAIAQEEFGQRNTTLQMEFDQQYGYPLTLIVSTSSAGDVYSAHASNLVPTP